MLWICLLTDFFSNVFSQGWWSLMKFTRYSVSWRDALGRCFKDEKWLCTLETLSQADDDHTCCCTRSTPGMKRRRRRSKKKKNIVFLSTLVPSSQSTASLQSQDSEEQLCSLADHVSLDLWYFLPYDSPTQSYFNRQQHNTLVADFSTPKSKWSLTLQTNLCLINTDLAGHHPHLMLDESTKPSKGDSENTESCQIWSHLWPLSWLQTHPWKMWPPLTKLSSSTKPLSTLTNFNRDWWWNSKTLSSWRDLCP